MRIKDLSVCSSFGNSGDVETLARKWLEDGLHRCDMLEDVKGTARTVFAFGVRSGHSSRGTFGALVLATGSLSLLRKMFCEFWPVRRSDAFGR